MKIVFMGTPNFAVISLEALIQEHEIVAVVTQPDKPKGRGKKLIYTEVKQFAVDKGIEKIYQPQKVRESEIVQKLKELNADIFIVVAYGQILSQEVIDIPRFGCINVHGSLLPKYRGAAPIQWAIINGDMKTGVTIMYMEKALDSGDMILKVPMDIEENETFGTLYDKMKDIGASALLKALESIENNTINAQKQDHTKATLAPMITKELEHINWNDKAENIVNLIRGLNPVPIAHTIYKDERLKILEAKTCICITGKVGQIVEITKEGFIVRCKDKGLLVTKVQSKNGKKMNTSDYLRGNNIEINTILE